MTIRQPEGDGPSWRYIGIAVSVTVVSVTPSFLVAALAFALRRDLDFSLAALGGLVAVFNLMAALSSPLAGRVVERYGTRAAVLVCVLATAAVFGAVGLFAQRWWHIAVLFGLGGMAASFANPAMSSMLARRVRAKRRGLAFGIRQAAVPASSMLAGLAVPVASLWLGWRATFVAAAVATLLLLLAMNAFGAAGTGADRARAAMLPKGRLRSLTVLAAGAAFGAGAAVSLSSFFVQSSVERGVSAAQSGLLMAAASLASIAVRTFVGWRADRRERRHVVVIARMMAAGAVAMAVIAIGPVWTLAPAAVAAFAIGWGWNGLLHFSVVLYHPETPAVASSVTQAGLFLGAGMGPLLFGLMAELGSFRLAWLGAAAAFLVASAFMVLGRRMLAASIGDAPSPA